MKKILLSIAGFDPSGGAGVLLDIQVFSRMGFAGMAVPTADTEQNTQGVKEVHPRDGDLIGRQYGALKEDVFFSGIKIGMIGSRSNLFLVGDILLENREIPVVVDPVFFSSSGRALLENKALPDFLSVLGGRMDLITPNLNEAGLLADMTIDNPETAAEAARRIYDHSGAACLIKGGHFEDDPVDFLFDGKQEYQWKRKRLAGEVHGTGCFFSAAALAYMAAGETPAGACEKAGDWTHRAIRSSIQLGKGRRIIIP